MAEVPDPRSFFPELARRHFDFLETDFGFGLLESDGYWVEWNSSRAKVSVGYFAPRCEFVVAVGLGSDWFDVGDVARLNRVRWDWGAVSGTEERLNAALEAAADLLKKVGGSALRGEPGVFEALQEQRTRESEAYTRKTLMDSIREAVDKAWREKDYAALVEVCEPHRADLSRFEVARLEFALKRIQESPNH